MERDNKEVNAHHSVDPEALLLRVKDRVESWYERARGITNLVSIDMKTALSNSLGEDIRVRIEIWATTTQTTLKLLHQLGAITGLWTREPITPAFIGMPGTTKIKLNNVQEEFDAARKARKASQRCLAEHMWTIRDRYVGRILDTRFVVTRTTHNLGSFDVEMRSDSDDMEGVALFSFDEDIDEDTHDKIGTNECNKVGRSGGELIKEKVLSIKNSWSSKDKVESGEYVLSRPPKKPGGEETDEVDTTTISRASVTTLDLYTTQTSTNSLKTAKTAPLTISEASSTRKGHDQAVSKGCGHNKVPSIVRMEPMNNTPHISKDNAPETLQDIEEELAQDLGLTKHQLLFKTGRQLKELSERKVQTTFDKVNAVALAAQRKEKEDFARVRKLAAQMENTSKFRRIKYMSPGLNTNESKVTSADKSKVIKFTRKQNQSKPPWETQQGASIFVFGNVKAKKTLVDSNKVSNVTNNTQKGGSLFVFGNVKTKKTLGDSDKVSNVPSKRRRRRRRRRKVDQFALRYQELEIEKNKRKQRRHSNWKKRQEGNIGRVTKVRALNILLVKMMPHPKRKRKGTNRPICTAAKVRRQSNKEERVTIKVKKRPLRRIYLLKKEEPCMLCLEKRQQSSPAVMFARLRSNRRYKPGD